MASSAAQQPGGPTAYVDPAIRQQTSAPVADSSTFGIPHLWLIVVLAVVVLVFFLLPGARRGSRKAKDIEKLRYRRRPEVTGRPFRRGPGTRLDL